MEEGTELWEWAEAVVDPMMGKVDGSVGEEAGFKTVNSKAIVRILLVSGGFW